MARRSLESISNGSQLGRPSWAYLPSQICASTADSAAMLKSKIWFFDCWILWREIWSIVRLLLIRSTKADTDSIYSFWRRYRHSRLGPNHFTAYPGQSRKSQRNWRSSWPPQPSREVHTAIIWSRTGNQSRQIHYDLWLHFLRGNCAHRSQVTLPWCQLISFKPNHSSNDRYVWKVSLSAISTKATPGST